MQKALHELVQLGVVVSVGHVDVVDLSEASVTKHPVAACPLTACQRGWGRRPRSLYMNG